MSDLKVERGATGAPATPPDHVETWAEIAQTCGRSISSCWAAARRKVRRMPVTNDGRYGRVRICRAELERWLDEERRHPYRPRWNGQPSKKSACTLSVREATGARLEAAASARGLTMSALLTMILRRGLTAAGAP